MNRDRKRKLEVAGFEVGDAADLLGLDEQERLYLEIRRSLGRLLRDLRRKAEASQVDLGDRIGMDQSTISRAERADDRVSLGLILGALIASGATREDIARAIRCSGS